MEKIKEFFAKKSIGFYLGVAIAILTLIGLIIYSSDPRAMGSVKTLLILALVIEAAYITLSVFVRNKYVDLISLAVAVLIALAFVNGFASQIDQLGWCVAGLDSWSVVSAFITATVINGIALAAAIAACFFDQNKFDKTATHSESTEV